MHTDKDNPGRQSQIGGRRRGNRWRLAILGTATILLMLPLMAMQFTDEVRWDETDFIVFGAMLLAACGAYELATRMSGNTVYRTAFGVAVVAAFLLVWVSLAVGIIGSEDNPANLMVFGVLAVGLIGALVVRLQPLGMARAMVATAIAQALVGVIASIAEWGMPHSAPAEVMGITAFFVAPWVASAALFWKAARMPARSAVD